MSKAIIQVKPSATVGAGDTVTLDGSRSRGQNLKYIWAQPGGTTVKATGQGTPRITFTAPDNKKAEQSVDHTLTFGLTVTDNNNQSSSTQAKILVKAVPIIPSPVTGKIYQVDVMNNSSASNSDVQTWMDAVKRQTDNEGLADWGATIQYQLVPNGSSPVSGRWFMLITDKSEQDGVLGYHEYQDSIVMIKIFTQQIANYGENPAVTISHEILESISDPTADITVHGNYNGRPCLFYMECGDPVESDEYSENGTNVSDFATKDWFGITNGTKYDQMGLCTKPFQILKGGYMEVSFNGSDWSEVRADKITDLDIEKNTDGSIKFGPPRAKEKHHNSQFGIT